MSKVGLCQLQFEYEADEAAVPCLCGARTCRKRLN